jgi:hypothetical protein
MVRLTAVPVPASPVAAETVHATSRIPEKAAEGKLARHLRRPLEFCYPLVVPDSSALMQESITG